MGKGKLVETSFPFPMPLPFQKLWVGDKLKIRLLIIL